MPHVRGPKGRPISLMTLEKYFRKEIDTGATETRTQVGNFMISVIKGSDPPPGFAPIRDEKVRGSLIEQFNRPTTYEALVAKNDLEVYDLQDDPEETRNLAQDGTAKGRLIMALNEKLNARIDQEVGDDDGRFLPLIHGYRYPALA